MRVSNRDFDSYENAQALPGNIIGDHFESHSSLMFTHMEFNPNRKTTLQNNVDAKNHAGSSANN